MSVIDLHIELGNANYITEILIELSEVAKKRKRILKEIEKRKLNINDMPEEEKKYFDALGKKENELIVELLKVKNFVDLPDDLKEAFKNEVLKSPSE